MLVEDGSFSDCRLAPTFKKTRMEAFEEIRDANEGPCDIRGIEHDALSADLFLTEVRGVLVAINNTEM